MFFGITVYRLCMYLVVLQLMVFHGHSSCHMPLLIVIDRLFLLIIVVIVTREAEVLLVF